MALKLKSAIVDYKVVSEEETQAAAAPASNVVALKQPEMLARPDRLQGTTYKIKSPVLPSALYITINDLFIDDGKGGETRRPFEVFINSKNMEHYQWIVALTRVMSAVFRKGGDIAFLVEELQSVFDPSGGYFKKGGKYIPSLVAEIGEVLKEHLEAIGMMQKEALPEHQQEILEEKRNDYMKANPNESLNEEGYPANAQLCSDCNTKAAILMDGCRVCLSCGSSKCS